MADALPDKILELFKNKDFERAYDDTLHFFEDKGLFKPRWGYIYIPEGFELVIEEEIKAIKKGKQRNSVMGMDSSRLREEFEGIRAYDIKVWGISQQVELKNRILLSQQLNPFIGVEIELGYAVPDIDLLKVRHLGYGEDSTVSIDWPKKFGIYPVRYNIYSGSENKLQAFAA